MQVFSSFQSQVTEDVRIERRFKIQGSSALQVTEETVITQTRHNLIIGNSVHFSILIPEYISLKEFQNMGVLDSDHIQATENFGLYTQVKPEDSTQLQVSDDISILELYNAPVIDEKVRVGHEPISIFEIRAHSCALEFGSSATNLMLYSEEFENANWITKGTAIFSANTDEAPDCRSTADKIHARSPNNMGSFYQLVSIVSTADGPPPP